MTTVKDRCIAYLARATLEGRFKMVDGKAAMGIYKGPCPICERDSATAECKHGFYHYIQEAGL